MHNFCLMDAATVIEERAALNDFLKRSEFDKPNWWSTGWAPFLDDGGGDYYCLDYEGTFTSSASQIICYWHDEERRSVMAPDFDSWLKTVVTHLEEDEVSMG